jgi:large conductance mechanosensitive channel
LNDSLKNLILYNMGIVKEFKEFAMKGSMLDIAIGIIIGVAFNRIVTSLVQDVLMPVIGYFVGGVNFENLQIVIQEEVVDGTGAVVQELVAIRYGSFLQTLFDFLIIALTVFVMIKVINRMKKKSEDVKVEEVPTPRDIELLTEIRDLLKK